MILVNKNNQRITGIQNKKMEIHFDFERGFRIQRWSHNGITSSALLIKDIFEVNIEGTVYASSSFEIGAIEHFSDRTQELVTVNLLKREERIKARLCFINEADDSIRLVIQFAVDWENGEPKETQMHLPFLADLRLAENDPPAYYFPANSVAKENGKPVIQTHKDFHLPLGIFDSQRKNGFSIDFPTLNELGFGWAQNRNADLIGISSLQDLQTHSIRLRPNEVLADTFELHFTAICDGWEEMFSHWREKARELLDFSEYQREDLKWNEDLFLHHFTYVYGKEAYDYENGRLDISRLIGQGEQFGGYDSILIWHQYPRLGVDRRDQWEFFTDYPGGIEGLRQTVEEAHLQGVKVFLPFKPWDVGFDESPKQATESIAQLIRETDADGIFLDTMDSVPKHFREAIDKVKPGVVFCSEAHPYRKHNIKLVTGSWDQYWTDGFLPEIDLLRYVLPEHPSPIISRWHVGERKDALIKRAIFNGTGIVVWQDIFGSWLPYSDEQKREIKRWKAIWQQNKRIYLGRHPLPLYPALQKGLYCNLFRSDDGAEEIYAFYNNTDTAIHGDLAVVKGAPGAVAELWQENSAEASLNLGNGNHILTGAVDPREIALFKVF